MDSAEIKGEEVDEEEIMKDLVYDIDPMVEMTKIREKMKKDKLKLYGLLMRQIQDIIHSAYNRAWKGIERKTIRQNIHVSETMGGATQPDKTKRRWFFG
jgi:hypothetical protein